MQDKPVSRRLLALSLAVALGMAPLAGHAQAPAPATPTQPAPPTMTPAPKAAPAPAPATPAPGTLDKDDTPLPGATPEPKTPEPKTIAPSATPAPNAAPNATAPKVPAPPTAPPAAAAPNAGSPSSLAPGGAPQTHEVEPNGSPQTPGSATMETIEVPARPIVYVEGQSSYDDAFKSIKASLDKVKAAMNKAGLKPSGHPITIFVDTDDKGFKYRAAVPIAAKPEGKGDFGNGVSVGESPAGSGLKFRHRGAFDEIDSTYDLIVAYLDEKGLQIDPPYIEEYLSDLTTPDDPNLEVDIYTFIKK